jgi:hypothetical protein
MSDVDDSPDTPEYVSPKRCLARSFRLSRDRWKHKANQRRQQIKALQVKARDLEVSRELWKQKALHLQAQRAELLGFVASQHDEAPALDHADPPTPAPAAPAAPPAPAAPTAGTAHAAHEADLLKKARRARR